MLSKWILTYFLVSMGVSQAFGKSAPHKPQLNIPARLAKFATGSTFVRDSQNLSPRLREVAIYREIVKGNVPDFLRSLIPVTVNFAAKKNKDQVTVFVIPDYLAIGSNDDYVRVPVSLPTAKKIANRVGMVLPTTTIVNAIYRQATVKLAPKPLPPCKQMTSSDYYLRHNRIVAQQLRDSRGATQLVAGHKKDIVITNRLRRNPNRIAIYGWHRQNGRPIQPLSLVHGQDYSDYSHGLRLVAPQILISGKTVSIFDTLSDEQNSKHLSTEGPIQLRSLGLRKPNSDSVASVD